MTVLIVNVKSGTLVLPSLTIPDDQHRVEISLPKGSDPLDMALELSFGDEWIHIGGVVALGAVWDPLPMQCDLCGNEYLPGDTRYEKSTMHQIDGEFHTPEPILPADRLIRVLVASDVPVSTVLTVTSG